jgi:hypothetical protein
MEKNETFRYEVVLGPSDTRPFETSWNTRLENVDGIHDAKINLDFQFRRDT